MKGPRSKRKVYPKRASVADNNYFPSFETVCIALTSGRIGVWSWDIASDRITWSSNLEAIHGLSPGSFDGTFAAFERDIHDDDREGVLATIRQALLTRNSYRVRYRLPAAAGSDERWIEATGTIIAGDDGPKRMIGLCQDVTDRMLLERELRGRARQQEAVAQLGERALAETNLESLLNDAAKTVAVTLSVGLVEVLELMPGDRELLLRAGTGWKSGYLGSILTSTQPKSYAGFTLESSIPIVIDDFKAEKRFAIPQYLHEHDCVSGMSTTIAGRDGRAYGVLGVCTTKSRHFDTQDISFLVAVANVVAGAIQRRQLDQRHELMIRELRHRSGNLFSQLLALFSQTAKNSRSMTELVSKFEARVMALAQAHRLIAEGGWKSTSLTELLGVLLAPYIDRTSLSGPQVYLEPDPAFCLTTATHELLSNAIKHGSLSRPKGRVELKWSVARTDRGMTLLLDWIEKSGPPARRMRRPGFGTRLIGLVIERQLNGEVQRTYTADGLHVAMMVPLTHERWPSLTPSATRQADAT
jgi:PAS domain S-box-containing protein